MVDQNPAVTTLKDAVESERTISEIETKRDIGSSIKYGDECRLQHRTTGEFLSSHTFDGDDEGNTSNCFSHFVFTTLHLCVSISHAVPSSGMPKMTMHPDNSVTFIIHPGFKADKIGHPLWSNQPFTFKSAISRLQVGRAEELVTRDGSESNPYELGHYRAVMQNQGCLLNAQVYI